MVPSLFLLQVIVTLSAISCELDRDKRARRKNDHSDKSLWKKEYEDELTDAMLSTRKKENITRVVQSTMSDTEAVIEKLMDSITSSEKTFKKIDSIDFRINRLDIEVHEKTNSINKRLTEILKAIRENGLADKLETVLDTLKTDVAQVKSILESKPRASGPAEGVEYHIENSVGKRLSSIESNVKTIMTGLDSIVTTMAEVKNRQYSIRSNAANRHVEAPVDNTMSIINEFRKMLHEQRQKKCECKGTRVDRSERYPTDCHEIQMQGFNVSGIYKIRPDDMEPFYILCDLTTAGGGWTVFQNRYDGSQDFYKTWSDYKYGFGNLAGEFWLGLDKLNYLTNQKLYELRVEVETQHGQEAYAGYSVFTLGPEHEGFRISTLGTYYGTAGDSLSYHAGQKFSTPDVDNDEWRDGSCASEHGGAWWYKECDKSNLNGKYTTAVDENKAQTIYWISFKGPNSPLTKTKMMIRPLPASRPVDFGESNRKSIESPKVRPILEKEHVVRTKDMKINYDVGHNHPQYRYEDAGHADAFFPSYAR